MRSLAVLAFLIASLRYSWAEQPQLPKYSVDLNSNPSSRWKHALEDFVDHHGVSAFEDVYADWLDSLRIDLPDAFDVTLQKASALRVLTSMKLGHPDLVAELQTISDVLSR